MIRHAKPPRKKRKKRKKERKKEEKEEKKERKKERKKEEKKERKKRIGCNILKTKNRLKTKRTISLPPSPLNSHQFVMLCLRSVKNKGV